MEEVLCIGCEEWSLEFEETNMCEECYWETETGLEDMYVWKRISEVFASKHSHL